MIDGIITLALLHTYCALCCAELAKCKDKNLKKSIICGLVFGIFAVSYYVLIKNDDEPPFIPGV